jgi:hypothetical protein
VDYEDNLKHINTLFGYNVVDIQMLVAIFTAKFNTKSSVCCPLSVCMFVRVASISSKEHPSSPCTT